MSCLLHTLEAMRTRPAARNRQAARLTASMDSCLMGTPGTGSTYTHSVRACQEMNGLMPTMPVA